MYNKTSIKQLAFAIIVQALKDLTLKEKQPIDRFYKYTAHKFFKSKLCRTCTTIAKINNINTLYNKYKIQKIKIRKQYKKRKKYYKRKKVTV